MTSALFRVLKAFISSFNPACTEQIDIVKQLLTELLAMVRDGMLDPQHSSDVLKLIKKEIFGGYTFELAAQFIANDSLE